MPKENADRHTIFSDLIDQSPVLSTIPLQLYHTDSMDQNKTVLGQVGLTPTPDFHGLITPDT